MLNLTNLDQLNQDGYSRPMLVKEGLVTNPINLYDAKTQLSQLVERAAAGEEIIIAKAGRPMARLVPMKATVSLRVPGQLKGKVSIGPDFDAALPADLAAAFSGEAP
jgi:prevent-host-death family protein